MDGVAPLTQVYDSGEFSKLLSTARRTDIVVLPDLRAIDERPTDSGRKPGVAFLLRVIELTGACLYIVDIEAGLTSRDGKPWTSHVAATYRRITQSRELDDEHIEKMKRGRRKKRKANPGIVGKYTSKAFQAEKARVIEIWTSRTHANADAAIEAIGRTFADLDGVSEATIERITEVGRTGKPSARSKKRTSATR